jgi:cobalt-zinc-cadmium efflux system membrane fusion protein
MKSAIQEIGGKQVVFVAQADKKQVQFVATPVQLGVYSSDGQWVEVKAGLNPQQQYVSQGSFLLKSELEKGEAEHGH